jgi:hypothetical protein
MNITHIDSNTMHLARVQSTQNQDLAEFRRMESARLKANHPPYRNGFKLKASGGATYPVKGGKQ